jgi:hypothetical protein
VLEWSSLPRSMKLDIDLPNKLAMKILEWMSPSWQPRLIRCLQTRVLYRILNLGVLKYEWGSGSAEPGTHGACSHAAGGCRRRSPPPRGYGGMTPEKFANFTCKILNFGAHLSKIIILLC